MGKAARATIATAGTIMATLVLMTAAIVSSGSWALVILGIGLAAASVRAARVPSAGRLAFTTAVILAIPFAMRVL